MRPTTLTVLERAQSMSRLGSRTYLLPARVERIQLRSGRRRWHLVSEDHGLDPACELKDIRVFSREDTKESALAVVATRRVERALHVYADDLEMIAERAAGEPQQWYLTLRTVDSASPSESGSVGTHDACARAEVLKGVDYLTRDYEGFRDLLLNQITRRIADWTDRTAADLGVMLSELLAYLADNLTYWQDAVATEAYLRTARRRISVRRHARLLEYALDEGSGARVCVHFRANGNTSVPKGTSLLAGGDGPLIVQQDTVEYAQARERGAQVFETMSDLEVIPELSEITILDGGRRNYTLRAGATQVSIAAAPLAAAGRTAVEPLVELLLGRFAVFDTVDEAHGKAHVVRITKVEHALRAVDADTRAIVLHWDPVDAPRTDLVVTRTADGVTTRRLTVLRGNVVWADFGETMLKVLPAIPSVETRAEIDFGHAIVPLPARPPAHAPASSWQPNATERMRPAIHLREYRDLRSLGLRAAHNQRELNADQAGQDPQLADMPWIIADNAQVERRGRDQLVRWEPVPDLLLCGPFSTAFVVEDEPQGTLLRFGDGVFGQAPVTGTRFVAEYRVGAASQSNVGVQAICTVVAPEPSRTQIAEHSSLFDAWSEAGLRVSNRLAASGARAAERLLTAKRQATSHARDVRAALTIADYRRLALQVSGVADAAVSVRWTGSWATAFVFVRTAREYIEAHVLARVAALLAEARVAGRDIAVCPPIWVPLRVRLQIVLEPGFGREGVQAALRAAFSEGFFDPSRWDFAATVWASGLVAWACGVSGVASASVLELRRVIDLDRGPEAPACLELSTGELPQVSDDPAVPEQGELELEVLESTERRLA